MASTGTVLAVLTVMMCSKLDEEPYPRCNAVDAAGSKTKAGYIPETLHPKHVVEPRERSVRNGCDGSRVNRSQIGFGRFGDESAILGQINFRWCIDGERRVFWRKLWSSQNLSPPKQIPPGARKGQ